MDPPCPSIQPGPAENEMQTSMVMGLVFPKPVVRSRFSAGLNLHKALEENPCPSTAGLKKRNQLAKRNASLVPLRLV